MTRQQRWAKLALERVRDHKGKGSESKYRTLCLKMPALLKQSGLVQSLAFMRSRSGQESKMFCDELATTYGLLATNDKSAGEVLQDQAQNAELPVYLVLSRDLIEVSVWFRRFAQSELKEVDQPQQAQPASGDSHART